MEPPKGRTYPNVEMKEPEFRELQTMQAFDRQAHIERGLDAGLSREEAERHAEEDHADGARDGNATPHEP